MNICIFTNNQPPRSKKIGEALLRGAEGVGFKTTMLQELDESLSFDLVVGYGWCNRSMFDYYRSKGSKYIYIDLGYWSRKQYKSDYNGYHKCVLNNRHPTRYFQRKRDDRRITIDTPVIRPWRQNRKSNRIIIAGMSGKGALSVGFEPMMWERRVVATLRRVSKRQIVYRPKPSWRAYTPIDNTYLSLDTQPISDILTTAHALVTFYSNASLDALAYGVPIYTVEGPARVASIESLEEIEDADSYTGYDRHQLMNDISYCHFTRDEIADGTMFRQFILDGMI